MKSMVLSYNNVTFNLGIGFKHKEKQNYLNYFKVGDLIKFSYMSLGAHGRPRSVRVSEVQETIYTTSVSKILEH